MKNYIVRAANWKFKVSLEDDVPNQFIEAATRAVSDIFGGDYFIYPTIDDKVPSVGFFISVCEEKYVGTDEELGKEFFCSSEIAFANAGLHNLAGFIAVEMEGLKSKRA